MTTSLGKSFKWVILVAGTLALASCSKPGSSPAAAETKLGPDGVDVSRVQQAFQSADQSMKFVLDDQLRMIGAGAYRDAITSLQKLVQNPKTTAEQRKALDELIRVLDRLDAAKPAR